MKKALLLSCAALFAIACHRGPVFNAGAKQPSVGGTIAGLVTTVDTTKAVVGRKVTVIDTKTGARYDTTTATNGGYTIKVPEGTYRIEIELRTGEALAKHPDDTQINNGDLDSGRDFVITVKAADR
jgi:hypothetical protein